MKTVLVTIVLALGVSLTAHAEVYDGHSSNAGGYTIDGDVWGSPGLQDAKSTSNNSPVESGDDELVTNNHWARVDPDCVDGGGYNVTSDRWYSISVGDIDHLNAAGQNGDSGNASCSVDVHRNDSQNAKQTGGATGGIDLYCFAGGGATLDDGFYLQAMIDVASTGVCFASASWDDGRNDWWCIKIDDSGYAQGWGDDVAWADTSSSGYLNVTLDWSAPIGNNQRVTMDTELDGAASISSSGTTKNGYVSVQSLAFTDDTITP